MRREDFYYELPDELIAHHPTPERRGSRLLQVDGPTGDVTHGVFEDLLGLVRPGDLMVFNDTRVIPARLYGQKSTGGKLEMLVERVLSPTQVLAHIKSSKSPKPGAELLFDGGYEAVVDAREEALFVLSFKGENSVFEILEAVGHMPLPPYIERADELDDKERYQTVYGAKKGAVAAPTAGLHFDESMLAELGEKGVELGFVTLHVGAGTFQPVRADEIQDHKMHSEVIDVKAELCEQVRQAKARGGRVIAVGTTSVRCLESAAKMAMQAGLDGIAPYVGETDIFIYPGYEFSVVDFLLTNFHLPESTLLMLVSAFVGYTQTMQAYESAVEKKYRFFSYGDAMFLTRNPKACVPIAS